MATLIRRYAVALLLLALSASAAAQFRIDGDFTVTPARAPTGATLTIYATGLRTNTSYDFALVQSKTVVPVATRTSSLTGTLKFTALVPTATAGKYTLVAQRESLGTTFTDASTAFDVAPSLTIGLSTTTPQAGKGLGVTVSNLSAGSLTLVWAGETVLGPIAVDAGSRTVKFVVPINRPASFPANVVLEARNHVGRLLAASSQRTVSVSGPSTEPPLRLVSRSEPTTTLSRGSNFTLSGQIATDEPLVKPARVKAYYFGDDGSVVPMGEGYALADGSYQMDAGAPSVATGGRYASGSGRYGYVMEGDTPGAQVVSFGETLQLSAEDDLVIRATIRANGSPVSGALVELVPDLGGIAFVDPDAEDPAEDDRSGMRASLLERSQLLQGLRELDDLTMAPTFAPGCPLTLARKATDAQGVVEFQIDIEAMEAVSWFDQVDCRAANADDPFCPPRAGFKLRMNIFAGHLGHGYFDPSTGNYVPHAYDIYYQHLPDQDIYQLQVQNVYPPGEGYTFGTVAAFGVNLQDQPPNAAAVGEVWVAGLPHDPDPPVYVGGFPAAYPEHRAPITFMPQVSWPYEFTYQFFTVPFPGPRYEIRFSRDPAFGGPIQSAELWLRDFSSGQLEKWRDFEPVSVSNYCSVDGTEEYRADLDYWRHAFGGQGGVVSGEIRIVTTEGKTGSQRLRFPFVKPPANLRTTAGLTEIEITERGPGDVATFVGQRLAPPVRDGVPQNEVEVNAPQEWFGDRSAMRSETENERGDSARLVFGDPVEGLTSFLSSNEAMGENSPDVLNDVPVQEGASRTFGSPNFETTFDANFPLFYYPWGVPELFSIEAGADLFFRTEFRQFGTLAVRDGVPFVENSTTEPRLLGGVDFWVDVDILFNLVDVGMSILPGFGLALPFVITDNQPDHEKSGACAALFILLTWWVDLPCLPIDPVCNVIEDELNADNSEMIANVLEPDEPVCDSFRDEEPVLAQGAVKSWVEKAKIAGRQLAQFRGPQAAIDFDDTGNGLVATVSADGTLYATPTKAGIVKDPREVAASRYIRDPQTVFYAPNRAVMVWAESSASGASLTPEQQSNPRAALQALSKSVHLRYARCTFDGCETPKTITPPGTGEGGVALAVCYAGTAGCPADGEVSLAFVRDTLGDGFSAIGTRRSRIFHSRYDPDGDTWSSPAEVDAAGLFDSHPQVAYAGGTPVIAWLRNDAGTTAGVTERALVYRAFGPSPGPVRRPSALPVGISGFSMLANAAGDLRFAVSAVDDGGVLAPTAPMMGNRHNLHVAAGNGCVTALCAISAVRLEDQDGRAIHGHLPKLVREADGDVSFTFRGLGFGPDGFGQRILPSDPPGFTAHTGDLAMIATDFTVTPVRVVPLTTDGAGHVGYAVGYDRLTDTIAAVSGQLPGAAAAVKRLGLTSSAKARAGKAVAKLAGDAELFVATPGPDVAIESVDAGVGHAGGATNFAVQVTLRNRGTAMPPAAIAAPRVDATWDGPPGVGTPAGSVVIPTLAANAVADLSLTVTVPTSFTPDEVHVLHLTAGVGEDVDAGNNATTVTLGELPVPEGLRPQLVPGQQFANLVWDPVADPRVVGYKVYRERGDGTLQLIGSSPVAGFTDLGAAFNVERSYRVASYSASGFDSAPSAAVPAMPYALDRVFGDGFEATSAN